MWTLLAAIGVSGLTVLAIAAPVSIVIVAAGLGLVWWMRGMDWWQRLFVLALLLLVGAMSRLEAVYVVTDYGRFLGVALLLAATLAGAHRFPLVRLTTLQRCLLGGLYGTMGLAAASVLWSVGPSESLQQLAVFAMLPVTIHSLMSHRWGSASYIRADLRIAVNLLTVVFAMGVALQYSGILPAPGLRLYGIFANPNSVAAIALLGTFLACALFAEKPSVWHGVSVFVAGSSVILSQSRTAFLALAAGALFIALRSSLKARVGASYAVLIAAILLLWTGINPLQSVVDRFSANDGGDLLNTRGIAWTSAIELTIAQPLGYGWRAGEVVFASLLDKSGFGFSAEGVHNSYLQYLLELGWLGLIPLSILVVTVALVATRAPRSGLSAGLAGLLIAGLVEKVAESVMFGMGSPYPYLFWFAVAATACLHEPSRVEPQMAQPALARR